ncbi:unnamed protein product [Lota lota]
MAPPAGSCGRCLSSEVDARPTASASASEVEEGDAGGSDGLAQTSPGGLQENRDLRDLRGHWTLGGWSRSGTEFGPQRGGRTLRRGCLLHQPLGVIPHCKERGRRRREAAQQEQLQALQEPPEDWFIGNIAVLPDFRPSSPGPETLVSLPDPEDQPLRIHGCTSGCTAL